MRWPGTLLALFLLLAMPAAPARAQESPRAAIHDGYGRMVFDWDGPVTYSADVADGRLVVRFNQSVEGDPRIVLRPLGTYLRAVDVSGDRRTLSFSLARPVQARAFLVGRSVVVDLIDQPGQAATVPVKTQSPAMPPAGQAATEVKTRGAAHTGFHRLVFEWPSLVDYRLEQKDGGATVSFGRAGRIDPVQLKEALPSDAGLVRLDTGDRATTVALALPDGARLRHFRSGNGIVVDIVRAADAKPPHPAGGPAPAVPLAPPPGAAEALPSVNAAATPAPPPKPPAEVVEQMRAAQPATETKTVTLTIPWQQPAGIAVFRRAGWLWVVFDKPQAVDLASLRQAAGDMVAHIEQTPHPDATVLRILTQPDYNPSLRRDGLNWILDFTPQPLRAVTPIEVKRQVEDRATSLFLPIDEGGATFALKDPEVGDTLQVVPVIPLGAGVFPGTELPEVELPQTAQGVVIVPRADGLQVRSGRTGITVAMPGGFSVDGADPSGTFAQARLPEASRLAGGALDIAGWLHGGPQKYLQERRRMEAQLGDIPRGQRNPLRLELARLHVANGNAAEALAIMRVMADEEPSIVDAPAYRALRGAAQLLMHRPALAIEDFSRPELQSVPEVAFWRAAAQASQGDAASQAKLLASGLGLLKDYPKHLKQRLGFVAAEALLDAGDQKAAGDLLASLHGERLSRAQEGQIAYLDGELERLSGDFDSAIESWRTAEAGDDRLYRARAGLARVELEMKLGRITPQNAAKQLDRMRFAWRGDDFEVRLLQRLADLNIQIGDYGEGLRLLRQLASNFREHKDVPAVAKQMSETFERLFLGGAADTLPPVTSIALFDEFRELTPTGEKGDEMIRRLADRLASVDLLDRAAELLQHQVDYRLQGVEKTRVGTRLAIVQLLNRKPDAALKALDASESDQAPEDLKRQRRQLAAQALSDLDRAKEAVARLKGDDTVDARLLRAEILWRQKSWKEAAEAFAGLVVEPAPGRPLDENSARFVLHWATALILADDERGIDRLRAAYAPLMAKTPFHDAFTLLTSEISSNVADYRKVADKIKEAEKFQAFMAAYRKRLVAAGLSSVN